MPIGGGRQVVGQVVGKVAGRGVGGGSMYRRWQAWVVGRQVVPTVLLSPAGSPLTAPHAAAAMPARMPVVDARVG